MRPDAPFLASSSARPAAALRDLMSVKQAYSEVPDLDDVSLREIEAVVHVSLHDVDTATAGDRPKPLHHLVRANVAGAENRLDLVGRQKFGDPSRKLRRPLGDMDVTNDEHQLSEIAHARHTT